MRLVLLSDDSITSAGFAQTFQADPGIEFIPLPAGLADPIAALIDAAPDVLIIDWGPQMTIEKLRQIQDSRACASTVLWMNDCPVEFAHCAIQMNVRGILRRDLPVVLIFHALASIAGGGVWFARSITDSLLAARPVRLSPRERQLVTLVSEGLSNKQIAVTLSISEGTVKAYLSKLFKKLRVKQRFELAIYSLRNFQSAHGPRDGNCCPASVLVRGAGGLG